MHHEHCTLLGQCNLSYLITNDPNPHIGSEAVEEILTLAQKLGSILAINQSIPSYRRLCCDLLLESKSIHSDISGRMKYR